MNVCRLSLLHTQTSYFSDFSALWVHSYISVHWPLLTSITCSLLQRLKMASTGPTGSTSCSIFTQFRRIIAASDVEVAMTIPGQSRSLMCLSRWTSCRHLSVKHSHSITGMTADLLRPFMFVQDGTADSRNRCVQTASAAQPLQSNGRLTRAIASHGSRVSRLSAVTSGQGQTARSQTQKVGCGDPCEQQWTATVPVSLSLLCTG